MVNILLSRYDISKKIFSKEFKKHIHKDANVAVIALSFRDSEIANPEDWDKFYGKKGVLSKAIGKSFKHYGIGLDNIEYIDYFRDDAVSAKKKLEKADIIYFPEGEAQNIMSRVIKLGLYNHIENHKGVVIGFGAGAQIQLAHYHVVDEKRMCYSLGFRFVDGFCIEPNYNNEDLQNYYIKRVASERDLPVYAIGEDGAIIIEDGKIQVLGDVHCFRKHEAAS